MKSCDVTGGDDVATRKYKSTCGGESGSFCCSVRALCVFVLFIVTFAGYLSPSGASSLKALVLPTKPLRTSSALVGKAYTFFFFIYYFIHRMTILQSYVGPQICRLDLLLIATERHLWLTLSNIKKKTGSFS
uniref:Uncharacterized protein n=1 Tax=Sinocyclocheilus rhinocerous TaxID=307959 RepID=A0A673MGI8_9TELE